MGKWIYFFSISIHFDGVAYALMPTCMYLIVLGIGIWKENFWRYEGGVNVGVWCCVWFRFACGELSTITVCWNSDSVSSLAQSLWAK